MNRLRNTLLLVTASLISYAVFAQSTPAQTPADAPVPQSAPQSTSQSAPADQSAPAALPDSPDTQVHPAVQPTGPTAVLDTSMGRITCKLFDKQAPNATANFVGLATGSKDWTDPATKQKVQGKPFYDGTTFHRVIPGFMIQGGDRLANGEGDPGYYFNDEFDPNLNFDVAGRLAMANSGPNTNGSQFFVTEDPADYLDQKYTIFGQCDDSSVWVVKSITHVNRDEKDKPIEAVTLNKVTIVPAGQPVPAANAAAAAPAAAETPAKPQP